jgi:prepilin-type N-terminal cleavage/methylation domain-containing protein
MCGYGHPLHAVENANIYIITLITNHRKTDSGAAGFIPMPRTNASFNGRPGFTLIELLVVIAIISILAALLLPVLASSKQRAQSIKCLSNMHQWGLAFHMYADDNRDFVPEEGNVAGAINDPGSPDATDNLDYAWYNCVAPTVSQMPLVRQYGGFGNTTNPPLPGGPTIFSCPSAPQPNSTYQSPVPTVRKAFFMYGENSRLCVNYSTRYDSRGNPTGVSQTKLPDIVSPSLTIFLAEVDPDSSLTTSPAQSNVTGFYAIARHDHNKIGNFAMCDGSSRAARTNEFHRTQGEADDDFHVTGTIALEWQTPRTMYWYPSPMTPD